MAEQDQAAGAGAVTDYEKRRQENILRNQQMLLQLGLANGRSPIVASLDDSGSGAGAAGRYRASPAGTKRARTPPQPVKQSRRLRGEAPAETFAVRRGVLHTLGPGSRLTVRRRSGTLAAPYRTAWTPCWSRSAPACSRTPTTRTLTRT